MANKILGRHSPSESKGSSREPHVKHEDSASMQSSEKDGDEIGIDEDNSTCNCGRRDLDAGNWIACDGEECKILWCHFECAGIDDEDPPAGKWFCSSCRPKPTPQRRKEFHTHQAKLFRKLGGGGGDGGLRERQTESPEKEMVIKSSKKSIAIKKPIPKIKPQWRGWTEMSEEEAEEYREEVERPWKVTALPLRRKVIRKHGQKKRVLRDENKLITRQWSREVMCVGDYGKA